MRDDREWKGSGGGAFAHAISMRAPAHARAMDGDGAIGADMGAGPACGVAPGMEGGPARADVARSEQQEAFRGTGCPATSPWGVLACCAGKRTGAGAASAANAPQTGCSRRDAAATNATKMPFPRRVRRFIIAPAGSMPWSDRRPIAHGAS